MIRAGVVVLLLTVAAATAARVNPGTSRANHASKAAVGPTSRGPAAAPAAAPALASLRADVERYIASTGWTGPLWSVTVVSLDRGDTLVALHPDLQLAPASNMKLFTTAAALYYLGPQYRYSTFLLADGPIENGVLNGDLIIYGTGDPTISDRFGDRKSTRLNSSH